MKPAPRVAVGLLAALAAACGAAGAPQAPGPAQPRAPLAVEARRTPKGWELRVTPPTTDVDGDPLSEPPRIAVFAADATCLGPPVTEAPAGSPLKLPKAAGAWDVAAWQGRQLGVPLRVDLPEWTPPPPAPEPPLAFRTPDGVVALTWQPPAEGAAVVEVERDGEPLGRFPAAQVTLTDTPPADTRAPRYRLRWVGPDYRTPWSPVVEVP
jgi:hypothetical protein